MKKEDVNAISQDMVEYAKTWWNQENIDEMIEGISDEQGKVEVGKLIGQLNSRNINFTIDFITEFLYRLAD